VESPRGGVELAVRVDGDGRELLVDGAARPLDAFLGRLAVVDLTTGRAAVLSGGPHERRRFIDRGILGLEASFLHSLGECSRVLRQRNALLRRGAARHGTELDAWDERLVVVASRLHVARRRYAERLDRALSEMGADVLGTGPAPRLRYRPCPQGLSGLDEEAVPAALATHLARSRRRDEQLGYTAEGPHRDDLGVELGGIDLRSFGSAGQVRAAMIALKLAKLSLLHRERGDAPLFLMDDFDTDLDDARMDALAVYLAQSGFQALVATSKEGLAGRLGAAQRLRVVDGVVQVG
jgi:DNA replication and repair protein RecF